MNQFRDFSDPNGFSQMIPDKSRMNCSQDTQQFAPNFLFGSQQLVRRSFTSRTGEYGSPGILRKRELSSGTGKSVHWSPVLVRSRSKSPDAIKLQHFNGSPTSPLWNGPPLRSLNEEVVGPPSKISRQEPSPSEQSYLRNDTDKQFIMDDFASGPTSDVNSDCWVTVFGFSADHRDEILELFSRHGDVMAQRSDKDANWVHIRYSSAVHARQALAKNATVFHNQMIGVVPCKDSDAMKAQDTIMSKNNSANLNGSCSFLENDMNSLLNFSGCDSPTRLVPSTSTSRAETSIPSRARLSFSARTGMRPLNSSFVSINGSSDASILKGTDGGSKEDSFFGKMWSSLWNSNGGDTSATTD